MTENTSWHARAAALAIDGRAFINGERVAARSGQAFDNLSPIDGRLLGQVARCDAVRALLAAGNAAERRLWKSEITIIYWGLLSKQPAFQHSSIPKR